MKLQLRFFLIPLAVLGALFLILAAERRPFLFANATNLGALILLEVALACLWQFDKVFLPVTMGAFLLPATGLPFGVESFTARWVFLAVGALVGFVVWIRKDRDKHFGLFHLIALFCVLSALASASTSSASKTGMLKVASLFLLFLYASTGGRLAMAGREKAFVRGLILACEGIVFVTAGFYLIGFSVFGNPNNLGAIIGVIATPVLLWAALTATTRRERQCRYTALALCGILLYISVCRAAIVADVIVVIVLTIALRRPGLLLRAAFVGALLLEIMAVANPSHMGQLLDSLTGRFVFKTEGRANSGVFGSRTAPWENTIAAVKQHPWFGSGFGTTDLGSEQVGREGSAIYTVEGVNREHGSSYLAMAEYMGMVGILPFLVLLLMVVRAGARVYSWMRRSGSAFHYAVPFALITLAGLVNAAFEDWLFAAGSYLCVFFWVSAFLLVDIASANAAETPSPAFAGSPAGPKSFSRTATSA
jgi:O-antigen ligase